MNGDIKKRSHKLRYFLLIIVIIILYYYFSGSIKVHDFLSNPQKLKDFVLGFGLLAPLALILLQIFQTTISIIPSQITTIVAGFIFGPIFGLVYSLIGAFLGSALIFTLSRKYGKKIVGKLFEKKEVVNFNQFFKQRKVWSLFFARIAPIFPNDLVSMAAGLTTIKFWRFNLISTLGFIFQMIILTYFGSELSQGKVSVSLIFISSIITGLLFVVLFKDKIKTILVKDIHLAEKAIEREFRKI